jgi:hypothetical protein
MKVRTGFVSNSSSSSFMIDKYYLSQEQIDKIKNHIEVSKGMDEDFYNKDESDAWDITEEEKYIKGFTSMDNFDMYFFLEKIGINEKIVEWD